MKRRILRYWLLLRRKIVTEQATPEYIAGGWALGMFVGCAIPFGLQLAVSIPLSFLLRVSKIGATVGTLLTNPVTIWFIYPAQTWVVYRIFFGNANYQLPNEWTWEAVKSLTGPVIFSFFMGGLILALILTPLTYWGVKRLVIANRARREKRRERRAAKKAAKAAAKTAAAQA